MPKHTPVRVGLIGAGNISTTYLQVAQTLDAFQIVACADVRLEAAQAQAERFQIPTVCTVDELLADPTIELVLNLTTPDAHGTIALAALAAGKSVYNEKPLAMTRAEAQQMLALAAAKGLLVGGAPDTFLGGGIQSCRDLIDAGAIGTPVAANAFMMSRGHEHWHPNPVFYYKPGGGPLFDMGPYYLTALVALLGPVARVTGSARISRPTRTISSQPRDGEVIDVEVPTHVAGLLDFASGPIGVLVTTFDAQASELPRIEIYGTDGDLERARSQHLRRPRAVAPRHRRPVGGDPHHPPVHGAEPRDRAGGHGRRPAHGASPAGQRRAGLPRAGSHARDPRGLGQRPACGHRQWGRTA